LTPIGTRTIHQNLKWESDVSDDDGLDREGTYDAKPGDMIIAVVGADIPYVIRPTDIDRDSRVRLVGE